MYTVAVYFKGDRLAHADGPSIQTAEMNAAKLALDTSGHLFPHLDYQKKIVERSLKLNKDQLKHSWEEEVIIFVYLFRDFIKDLIYLSIFYTRVVSNFHFLGRNVCI